jgi:beta-phosphoglucomutase
MKLEGVIFDLDGVIVDTVKLHFEAWQRAFLDFNYRINFNDYKQKIDGILSVDGARAILGDAASQEQVNRVATLKHEYFLKILHQRGIEPYPGIVDFLKQLNRAKIKFAVISSSRNSPQILETANIKHLFDVIISGKAVTEGKPAPDIFLLALENLKCRAAASVAIEDAPLGVTAAKRAGLKCVGVDHYDYPSRLGQADFIISHTRELTLELLESLLD